MPVTIPNLYMQVIQPIKLNVASKNFSITYGLGSYASVAGAQTALNAADLLFKDAWDNPMDNSYSMLPATGYYRDNDGNLNLLTATGAIRVGLNNLASPPPNVTLCIRKRTAFVGKSFRGRNYFPGLLAETIVDEAGNVTPSNVAAFQNIADAWLTSMLPGPVNGMKLFHEKVFPGPGPTNPTPVTKLLVQPIVRTQRKRLPRG